VATCALEDPFGCVDPQAVEDVIGAAALTRYRRMLAVEWERHAEQAQVAAKLAIVPEMRF